MAATKTTWKPHTVHGELDTERRRRLPKSAYAFPRQRKEPLTDAEHVQNALARFDQVDDVDDDDRELAFANIRKAAEHYGVEVAASSWRSLGRRPHGENAAH
jgi:hypothetical protein